VQEFAAGFELAHVVEQGRGPDVVDALPIKPHARRQR
jgi:hypothetical protein